MSIAFVKSIA